MEIVEDSYLTTLDGDALRHAAEVLNEVEDRLHEDVAKVRGWLRTQPHLNAHTDAMHIVRFLRGCKYDHEKTRRKITNFYGMRGRCTEWFDNRCPTLRQIQDMLDMGVFLPLRKHNEHRNTVVIIRAAVHNPAKHRQDDLFKTGMMVLDRALEMDETISVYGVIAIIDLAGIGVGHARQLTIKIIRNAVHAWQDCYPVRIRRLDFINAPIYVNVVLNTFRRFMREKLRNRVHVHYSSLNALYEEVSPAILPYEYGGTDGSLQELKEYWKSEVMENQEWFVEDEKHKAIKIK